MELRHLRYFIAVAETGSLTLAAERRLHTSQPSLSRQIRDLEDQVGVELLSRGARGVELTAAGQAFSPCGTTGQTEVCTGLPHRDGNDLAAGGHAYPSW